MSSVLSSGNNESTVGVGERCRKTDRKRQASFTLVIVVLMFAVLWLPVHIHLLLVYFGDIPDTRLYEVGGVTHDAHDPM